MNPRPEIAGIPRAIWLLAGGFLLLTASYGVMVPLNGDEAFYWQHGRHLDWGFYTHPPMTGFSVARGHSISYRPGAEVRLTYHRTNDTEESTILRH